MARRLPPLGALRAFEAAARHVSFSRAAEELNVTPAAISHQVKQLEAWLGVPLFRRLTRALRLTDEGQALLPALGQAFDRLAPAVGKVSGGRGPSFDSTRIAVDAAIDGLGVAIGGTRLFADVLAQGRLFQPFALAVPSGRAYWLVSPAVTAERPKVRAFRDWVLAEVASAQA